jgi:hypothetical protein
MTTYEAQITLKDGTSFRTITTARTNAEASDFLLRFYDARSLTVWELDDYNDPVDADVEPSDSEGRPYSDTTGQMEAGK